MSDTLMRWTDRGPRLAGATAVTTCVLSLTIGGAAAADCGSLAGKTFGDVTITAATNVSPPSSVVGLDPPTPVAINAAFCRIQGSIKPSSDSNIAFEVWLPPQSAWNGKYEGIGNGGFAGSLIYPPMYWALQAGYAVSATDTGHSGGSLDAPGPSAIRRRSRTSAGGRSMKQRPPPRRSSRPITRSRQPIPISAAARMADAKR